MSPSGQTSNPARIAEAGAGPELSSLALALVAVASFSLTLPLTRYAVPYFDASFIAVSRAALAGVLGACVLLAIRAKRPTGRQLRELVLVAGGVVFGFPLAASFAMRSVPASHGGVVVALVPLATAWLGSRIANERPPLRFWLASLAGSAAVIAFALRGGFTFVAGDAWLLVASASAAIGYAYGGRLTRELGAPETISWALVLSLPVTLPAAFVLAPASFAHAPAPVLVSLVYLGVVNQLLAFFAWNRALAVGGIARISQTQLAQPFLTILASAILLGERIEPASIACGVVVVACVAVGRRAIARGETRSA